MPANIDVMPEIALILRQTAARGTKQKRPRYGTATELKSEVRKLCDTYLSMGVGKSSAIEALGTILGETVRKDSADAKELDRHLRQARFTVRYAIEQTGGKELLKRRDRRVLRLVKQALNQDEWYTDNGRAKIVAALRILSPS